MARPTNTNAAASFVAAFVLVVVLAASAGAASSGSPEPSRTPVPSPSPVVTPVPTADPTPVPTSKPSPTSEPTQTPDGFVVDLDTADDSDVTVVIDDADGVISGAKSGRAADGMSVRWGDIAVENVDDDTLRLTWVGWQIDEIIEVAVAADGDGLALTFTQKLPYENTDAMGADRVLIIDVATAVQAEDVSARFVPGA
jgi:hypothetical protein